MFARTNVVVGIIRKHVFCVKSLFTDCGKLLCDASECQRLTTLAADVTIAGRRDVSIADMFSATIDKEYI